MAGEKHLYLVATGGYVSSATVLQNEIWQTGIRVGFFPGGSPDPVDTFENQWDVVAASIDRTETNWTISGNWTVEGGVSDFDPGDYLNDQAGPAFDTWLGTAGVFAAEAQLHSLKLYPIGAPTGVVIPAPPYAQGSPCTLTYTGTLPVGAVTGGMLTPQSSIVASLRTPQVGRRGRGRMYGPPAGRSVLGNGAESGVLTAANRALVAAAYQTLVQDLFVSTSTPAQSNVYPLVTGAPYTNFGIINQVRVGNIVDGQSRRRNSLIETYSSVPVAYS